MPDELRKRWRTFCKVTWPSYDRAHAKYELALERWEQNPIGPRPGHPPMPIFPEELRGMQ